MALHKFQLIKVLVRAMEDMYSLELLVLLLAMPLGILLVILLVIPMVMTLAAEFEGSSLAPGKVRQTDHYLVQLLMVYVLDLTLELSLAIVMD